MSQASSSKVCKYDVFLSFRGKDTRRTFVSHLFNALKQRGIPTFKDDERLETGKSISVELLKAIEEAKFAVVIFSKKYASSRWCLEELAHIIKCKNELIPVFYDVSPSDVRHQNPPFAKSFTKHEKKNKDDMEKVQRWRDAFAEAGKISGYHLPNFKDEADCIKKLVDDIFPKLLQDISPIPENLVGMKSQVEELTSLLDMESNDVRSIGIWGMGGIGKTEIANVLCEIYRHRFEATCVLSDVGTVYQKNGLIWLLKVIIRKLLGENMTLTSDYEGLNILNRGLRWKKVLIVLDDVNHREQLEFLVGTPERFGSGSRIVLTSRDKHLLISYVGDNLFEVQLLPVDEALELFSRHAFREKSPKKDFMELSRGVVACVGGLPLALKVLGSSLYQRDKEEWRDMIARLKKIPHNDILGKLRISFDGLDEEEKRIFLDIACLFSHRSLHHIKRVFESFEIQKLVEKSLLSSKSYGSATHNMIMEMGQNIAREEYTNSRIWLREDVRDLFEGKLEAEKVEGIRILETRCFKDKVFKKMPRLRLLIIYCSWGGSTITYLPPCLRWLHWDSYPSSSLPEYFEPLHLIGLSLRCSKLVSLWPTSKNLSNLKHLDLSHSRRLTKTPNFYGMPNLKTLNLWECVNLEKVHRSLGHCRMLTELNLRGCKNLKKLPKFVTMESLETLYLYGCKSLEEFPEICGDMRRLSTLCVGSPWIRSLPLSLGGLTNLELDGCEVLESIPYTIRNLKFLTMKSCNKLATLPNSLFESQQLLCLYIRECSGLVELPISLGVQKKLRWLEIDRCENLKKLPSAIQMEPLEHLQISDCPKLDTCPDINGDVHSLKHLSLNSSRIREPRSSIGNLWGRLKLDLKGLVSLPDSLCNLKNLRWLNLSGCKKLQKLPINIGDLSSNLFHLNLQGCEDLVSLPDSLCNLKNLKMVDLSCCKKIEKLPENIGDLQELTELDASETAISRPPPSISKLGKLAKLRFSHEQQCQHSSSFVLHQVSGLSSLIVLDLRNLNILGGLPEDLGSLQSLEYLDVSGSNISCLPKSINKLSGLQHLNVQFCENLNKLPRKLLPNLVDLGSCYHLALKNIRDLKIKCLKLQLLRISWCGQEKSGCGAISSEVVNEFLKHFLRTRSQCDSQSGMASHQRDYFLISFPEIRISELFDYPFINQNRISIDLNPSWYTDKFMGFLICYCLDYPDGFKATLALEATLVCKSDPARKHSLNYGIPAYEIEPLAMYFIYIPFESLWHSFDNKGRKNPNDYFRFEVSNLSWKEGCWGIRLEYEKQRTTRIPKLFQVPRKDTAVTTECGCTTVLEQPESSLASSLRASATDKGLHFGNENKEPEVDQAAMAVQKEPESLNVQLTRVFDSPSRKTGDASRKRKRKRKRNKKRKVAGTNETSCSNFTKTHA